VVVDGDSPRHLSPTTAALPQQGLVLVVGGSRSGKSRWAETLAERSGLPVLYVATAADRPGDAAWIERVQQHRQRRPSHWSCLETGADLATALQGLQDLQNPQHGHLVLIDALGTWLAQHLDDDANTWHERCQELLAVLNAHSTPVVLVCEEVGLGVVPPTPIGGLFRDRMGALQQALMAQATASWLVIAGRALDLHACSHPVPAS